jgi:hypothetical protein
MQIVGSNFIDMKNMIRLLIFVILAASCNQTQDAQNKTSYESTHAEKSLMADSSPIKLTTDSLLSKNITWADSLLVKYLKQTKNELINSSRNDSIPFEWIFDRKEDTDSATYLIFQIGHSFEYKFITDEWLYIDSQTRKIYQYDLPNDKLVRWSE